MHWLLRIILIGTREPNYKPHSISQFIDTNDREIKTLCYSDHIKTKYYNKDPLLGNVNRIIIQIQLYNAKTYHLLELVLIYILNNEINESKYIR